MQRSEARTGEIRRRPLRVRQQSRRRILDELQAGNSLMIKSGAQWVAIIKSRWYARRRKVFDLDEFSHFYFYFFIKHACTTYLISWSKQRFPIFFVRLRIVKLEQVLGTSSTQRGRLRSLASLPESGTYNCVSSTSSKWGGSIWIKNDEGLRIDPWGTPQVRGSFLDANKTYPDRCEGMSCQNAELQSSKIQTEPAPEWTAVCTETWLILFKAYRYGFPRGSLVDWRQTTRETGNLKRWLNCCIFKRKSLKTKWV